MELKKDLKHVMMLELPTGMGAPRLVLLKQDGTVILLYLQMYVLRSVVMVCFMEVKYVMTLTLLIQMDVPQLAEQLRTDGIVLLLLLLYQLVLLSALPQILM